MALARAFAWRSDLETGKYASVTDLARQENVHESYIRRQLQLNLLAPGVLRKILDGTHTWSVSDNQITKREIPVLWTEADSLIESVI